jgi:hypothetical protein
MSPHTAITKRVLKQLRRSRECELEELVFSCREFTWHETLVELIRLNQAGQVEMKTYTKGNYNLRLCFPRQHDLSRPRTKGGRRRLASRSL